MSTARPSTVAVLGAAGFIGGHVVAELVRRGRSVIAVTNTPLPANQVGNVRWLELDLDEHTVDVDGPTTCIHLAEPSVLSDPAAAELNLARARRILATPFERIVYLSSAVVYGAGSAAPRREMEAVEPEGIYARAKLAVERAFVADPRCVIARIANVYGHGMSPYNVLSDIVRQIDTPGDLVVRDLAPVRDYIHVTDVARALIDLGDGSVSGIFNIGTTRGTSVRELAQLACAAAGTPDRTLVASSPSDRASVLVLDVQRMRRELGWSPSVTLEQGIAELLRDQRT